MSLKTAFLLSLCCCMLALASPQVSIAADVTTLTAQLSDPAATVRAAAANELGQLGKEALDAVPALAKAVADPDASVRHAAIEALRSIAPGPKISVPLLVKVLSDAEPTVAMKAVQSLSEVGPDAVPFLTAAVKENEKARYWACLVINSMGADAAGTVPALVEVMGEGAPEVRREVVMALGEIGPAAKEAVPTLVQALSDQDKAIVWAATHSLGLIGPAAAAATPQLTENTGSDDQFLRMISGWARVRVNPDNNEILGETVALLAEGVVHSDRSVRLAAGRALIDLDPSDELMAPHRARILEEKRPEVVEDILNVIAARGKKAVPRLARALTREDSRAYRGRIAQLLGEMGPDATEALPALIAALEDSDPEARESILTAFASIGAAHDGVVPAIVARLEDEDEEVQHSAVLALGQLGAAARPAVPALRKRISGDDPFQCTVCAWALAHIEPQAEGVAAAAVPLLVQALEHERAFVRSEAATALGLLGPAAASALPALQKSLHDSDESVREAAKAALGLIKPN